MTPEEHELFSKEEILFGLIPNVQKRPEVWDESVYRITDKNAWKLERELTDEKEIKSCLQQCGIPVDEAEEIYNIVMSYKEKTGEFWRDCITWNVHQYLLNSMYNNKINLDNNKKTRFCGSGKCGICKHREEKEPVKVFSSIKRMRKKFEERKIQTEDPRKDDENILKKKYNPIKMFKSHFPDFQNFLIKRGYFKGNYALLIYVNDRKQVENLPCFFADCQIIAVLSKECEQEQNAREENKEFTC